MLQDYCAFLRQRNLPVWAALSVEAQTGKQARPENLTLLRQIMASLVSDKSDLSDKKLGIKQQADPRRQKNNVKPNIYIISYYLVSAKILKKAHATKMQQIEEEISGMKLKEQKQEKPEGDTAAALKILGIIIAGAILAMIFGNIRRKRKA